MHTCSPTAAPLGRRLEAFVLDWTIGVAAGAALCLVSAGLLLASSGLDRRDPPSWSLYGAMLIVSLWPPLWLVYTSVAWAWFGATAGMHLSGVCVTSRNGTPPGTWRSAARAALVAAVSAPLLTTPLLVGIAVAAGTTGPLFIAAPVAVLVLASVAGCVSTVFSPAGEAWLDRLSGTRVVLSTSPRVSA